MSNGNGNIWPSVTVVFACIAIVVSLTILQGQTTSRVDSVRTELLNEVRALRAEMRSEFQQLRTREPVLSASS